MFLDQKENTHLFGEDNKRIVCLAGLREVKDHLNLLKAFCIFKKDFKGWSVHLIGKDYEDEYSQKIKEFIQQNSLSKEVFLYGLRTDIKYILSQARIGVLASKSEGLPISLLEYGLAKIPVLVTNVGKSKDIVKNNEALVAPNNSEDFAHKLIKIVKDRSIESTICKDLNQEVLQNYSKENSIIKLKEIYKSLC